MKHLFYLLTICVLASCSKDNTTPNDPGDNGSDTTIVSSGNSWKMNGVTFNADSAVASYANVGVRSRLQVNLMRMSEDGSYIDEALGVVIWEPDYQGVGDYDLPINSNGAVLFDNIISMTDFTSSFQGLTYNNYACYQAQKGDTGVVSITKDHTEGSVSGTFYGSVCVGDSLVEITDGKFSNVPLL